MWLPMDLVTVEPANRNKSVVSVGDVAFSVGCRHESRVVGEVELALSDREIASHGGEILGI